MQFRQAVLTNFILFFTFVFMVEGQQQFANAHCPDFKTAVDGKPHKYIEIVHMVPQERDCPQQTHFDQSTCECSILVLNTDLGTGGHGGVGNSMQGKSIQGNNMHGNSMHGEGKSMSHDPFVDTGFDQIPSDIANLPTNVLIEMLNQDHLFVPSEILNFLPSPTNAPLPAPNSPWQEVVLPQSGAQATFDRNQLVIRIPTKHADPGNGGNGGNQFHRTRDQLHFQEVPLIPSDHFDTFAIHQIIPQATQIPTTTPIPTNPPRRPTAHFPTEQHAIVPVVANVDSQIGQKNSGDWTPNQEQIDHFKKLFLEHFYANINQADSTGQSITEAVTTPMTAAPLTQMPRILIKQTPAIPTDPRPRIVTFPPEVTDPTAFQQAVEVPLPPPNSLQHAEEFIPPRRVRNFFDRSPITNEQPPTNPLTTKSILPEVDVPNPSDLLPKFESNFIQHTPETMNVAKASKSSHNVLEKATDEKVNVKNVEKDIARPPARSTEKLKVSVSRPELLASKPKPQAAQPPQMSVSQPESPALKPDASAAEPATDTIKEKRPKSMKEILNILRKKLRDKGIPKEEITVKLLKKMIRKDRKLLAMVRANKRFKKRSQKALEANRGTIPSENDVQTPRNRDSPASHQIQSETHQHQNAAITEPRTIANDRAHSKIDSVNSLDQNVPQSKSRDSAVRATVQDSNIQKEIKGVPAVNLPPPPLHGPIHSREDSRRTQHLSTQLEQNEVQPIPNASQLTDEQRVVRAHETAVSSSASEHFNQQTNDMTISEANSQSEFFELPPPPPPPIMEGHGSPLSNADTSVSHTKSSSHLSKSSDSENNASPTNMVSEKSQIASDFDIKPNLPMQRDVMEATEGQAKVKTHQIEANLPEDSVASAAKSFPRKMSNGPSVLDTNNSASETNTNEKTATESLVETTQTQKNFKISNLSANENSTHVSKSIDPKVLPPFPFLLLMKPTLVKHIIGEISSINKTEKGIPARLVIQKSISDPIILNNEAGIVFTSNESISGVREIHTKKGTPGIQGVQHEFRTRSTADSGRGHSRKSPSVKQNFNTPREPVQSSNRVDTGGVPIPVNLVSDMTKLLERIEKKTSQKNPPIQNPSRKTRPRPSRNEISRRLRKLKSSAAIQNSLGVKNDHSIPIVDVQSSVPDVSLTPPSGNLPKKQSLGVNAAVDAVKKLDTQIANLLKTMNEGRLAATPGRKQSKTGGDNQPALQPDLSHLGIGRPELKPRLVENKPQMLPNSQSLNKVDSSSISSQTGPSLSQSQTVDTPASDFSQLASRLTGTSLGGSSQVGNSLSSAGSPSTSSPSSPSNIDVNGLLNMVKFALNQPPEAVATSPLMNQIQQLVSSQTTTTGQTVESPLMTQIKQALDTLSAGSNQGQTQQVDTNAILNEFLSKISPSSNTAGTNGGSGNPLGDILSQLTSGGGGGGMGGGVMSMPQMSGFPQMGGGMPFDMSSMGSGGLFPSSDMPFNMGGNSPMGMLQSVFQNEGGGDAAEMAGGMFGGGGGMPGMGGMGGMSGNMMFGSL